MNVLVNIIYHVLQFPHIEEQVGGVTLLMVGRGKKTLPALLFHITVAEHKPVSVVGRGPGVVVTLPTIQTTVHHHILQLVVYTPCYSEV